MFLQNNSDYEMFKRLSLDASHWGGNVDEIVPQLQERIRFLELLLSDLKGVKYIKHAKRAWRSSGTKFWSRKSHGEIYLVY